MKVFGTAIGALAVAVGACICRVRTTQRIEEAFAAGIQCERYRSKRGRCS